MALVSPSLSESAELAIWQAGFCVPVPGSLEDGEITGDFAELVVGPKPWASSRRRKRVAMADLPSVRKSRLSLAGTVTVTRVFVEASAVAVDEILGQLGHSQASYIISGIPFSTIPAALRERILRKTCDVLEPGGSFLVYQFSTRVLQDLQRIFRYVRRRFEPLNVLPAHLFFCGSSYG